MPAAKTRKAIWDNPLCAINLWHFAEIRNAATAHDTTNVSSAAEGMWQEWIEPLSRLPVVVDGRQQ